MLDCYWGEIEEPTMAVTYDAECKTSTSLTEDPLETGNALNANASTDSDDTDWSLVSIIILGSLSGVLFLFVVYFILNPRTKVEYVVKEQTVIKRVPQKEERYASTDEDMDTYGELGLKVQLEGWEKLTGDHEMVME